MFLGHVAVGLAAKRVAPKTSLLWLVAAPSLLDLLWPVFLALGLEEVRIAPGITAATPLDFVSYPWSHSLVMTLAWSSLAAAAYLAATGYAAGALAIAAGVTSHWVFDWISHRPDMPLAPWSEAKAGLGLWNSIPATLAVEGLLFCLGVWLYVRTTKPGDPTGSWAFVAFTVFLDGDLPRKRLRTAAAERPGPDGGHVHALPRPPLGRLVRPAPRAPGLTGTHTGGRFVCQPVRRWNSAAISTSVSSPKARPVS